MVTFEDFKKTELVIAEIKEVREHPNADRLYILKIHTGQEEKQLVAGIRLSYPDKEKLIGRKIVVVNNLEPAVIRGEESLGMLLAASGESGPVLLSPEKDVPAGTTVK